MGEPQEKNSLQRAIKAATRIEAHEVQSTVVSFVFVFVLMAS